MTKLTSPYHTFKIESCPKNTDLFFYTETVFIELLKTLLRQEGEILPERFVLGVCASEERMEYDRIPMTFDRTLKRFRIGEVIPVKSLNKHVQENSVDFALERITAEEIYRRLEAKEARRAARLAKRKEQKDTETSQIRESMDMSRFSGFRRPCPYRIILVNPIEFKDRFGRQNHAADVYTDKAMEALVSRILHTLSVLPEGEFTVVAARDKNKSAYCSAHMMLDSKRKVAFLYRFDLETCAYHPRFVYPSSMAFGLEGFYWDEEV